MSKTTQQFITDSLLTPFKPMEIVDTRYKPQNKAESTDKSFMDRVSEFIDSYREGEDEAVEEFPIPESTGNKVVQRLKREAYVELLGQRALMVDMNADVLPTLPIDPRSNAGNEVVRLNNGTPFSGEYLITEMITSYVGGKRTRKLSGVGMRIDGLNIVPAPVDPTTPTSVHNTDTPINKETEPEPPLPENTQPDTTKSPEEDKNVFFDTVKNWWTDVTK